MAYLDSSNVEDLVADIKALADQTYATPSSIPSAATATPEALAASGSVGSSTKYAKEDHVHPLPSYGNIVSYSVVEVTS